MNCVLGLHRQAAVEYRKDENIITPRIQRRFLFSRVVIICDLESGLQSLCLAELSKQMCNGKNVCMVDFWTCTRKFDRRFAFEMSSAGQFLGLEAHVFKNIGLARKQEFVALLKVLDSSG